MCNSALTGVAQLVGCHVPQSTNHRFDASQGRCLGCGVVLSWGLCERQLIYICLPLFLFFSPLTVNKLINKILNV